MPNPSACPSLWFKCWHPLIAVLVASGSMDVRDRTIPDIIMYCTFPSRPDALEIGIVLFQCHDEREGRTKAKLNRITEQNPRIQPRHRQGIATDAELLSALHSWQPSDLILWNLPYCTLIWMKLSRQSSQA